MLPVATGGPGCAARRDAVLLCRGLALLPGIGFVSASHDHTLRVWDDAGALLAELVGHTALVYRTAALADGLIASASEDNSVRLWQASGQCLQTIEHPGMSSGSVVELAGWGG